MGLLFLSSLETWETLVSPSPLCMSCHAGLLVGVGSGGGSGGGSTAVVVV